MTYPLSQHLLTHPICLDDVSLETFPYISVTLRNQTVLSAKHFRGRESERASVWMDVGYGWHQVTSEPRLKPILGLGFGLEVPWEGGKGGRGERRVEHMTSWSRQRRRQQLRLLSLWITRGRPAGLRSHTVVQEICKFIIFLSSV